MFAKKVFLGIATLLMTSPLLFSCGPNDPNVTYLRILNSEDYIGRGTYIYQEGDEKKEEDIDVINDFEEWEKSCGRNVKVIYETFDTMENMYNTLKTGKTKYDLVCASDYMVQKLVNLDLLERMDNKVTDIPNYEKNASSFIRDRLKNIKWGDKDKYNLDDYSVCYMWGTLGLLYNPTYELLDARGLKPDDVHNAMTSYDSLWDERFQKVVSVKDSMRDTYAIGLIHTFKDELKDKSIIERQKIFDYGGVNDSNAKEHIDLIKQDLLTLRDNIFGFEVDSGKEDIVTEKIGIDTAWSGDAVKAINNAEEEKNLKLYYSIPTEGSNLWFDCWTMQRGANKELSYEFLDFISEPNNAIKNMKIIGYTSSIQGKEIFDYYNKKYAPISNSSNEKYDVSYFFDDESQKELTIDKKYLGRQIAAQFPKKEVADSLMVMKDYGDNNDLILKMWEEVKHESLPIWAIVLFVIEIVLIASAIFVFAFLKFRNKKQRQQRRLKSAA
ncbi:MAG: extracellular solute-binding protein [Bacilli bacterium]|nr:extracellular solute-binding protein [Bacilli bacterium]